MLIILFLALFCLFLYLAFKQPCSVLILIFCMFALEQLVQANFPFFLRYSQFINILIGALVLIAVIRTQLFYKVRMPKLLKEELLVYLLFAYAFISINWSPEPLVGYEQWRKQWPYMVVLLILAPRLIVNPSSVSKIFFLHAFIGGIISVLLLTTVEWQGRMIDIGSQGSNPLATAQMAGYAILAALLYNSQNRKQMLVFVLKIAIAVICGIVAIRSGSRGQLIATFVALIVFWPVSYRVKNFVNFTFSIAIFGISMYLLAYGVKEFWSESTRFSVETLNYDAAGRLDQSFLLVAEWLREPSTLIVGLGNSSSYSLLGFYPHNVVFEILGEEGLVGLSLYAFILFYLLRNIKELIAISKGNASWRKTTAVLSAFVLFTLLLSMKQGNLVGNQEFFMMTMIIARYRQVLFRSLGRMKKEDIKNPHPVTKVKML